MYNLLNTKQRNLPVTKALKYEHFCFQGTEDREKGEKLLSGD